MGRPVSAFLQGLNESILICQLLISVVAGSDTTGGVVQQFLYAMLLRPDIQKRAQEEIDRVIGRDRLPTCEEYVSELLVVARKQTY